jgi:hypothetical protein
MHSKVEQMMVKVESLQKVHEEEEEEDVGVELNPKMVV